MPLHNSFDDGHTQPHRRLSRFSLIIDYLMYLRVHFVCADNPNDDEFYIKMRVLFGEEELRKISERTRKALASRRQRGLKLGNPEQFHDEGRRKGAARVKQQALANDTNKQILDTILDKVHRGMSPQQIASHLNSINLKTIRGKKFRTGTINMYLKRARELQLVLWPSPFLPEFCRKKKLNLTSSKIFPYNSGATTGSATTSAT